MTRGQDEGMQDYRSLFLRTMRYSLRRALSLDSVDGGTHNPKVGGSNPPPATKPNLHKNNHLDLIARVPNAECQCLLTPISGGMVRRGIFIE
jgi:hypothetical protein